MVAFEREEAWKGSDIYIQEESEVDPYNSDRNSHSTILSGECDIIHR